MTSFATARVRSFLTPWEAVEARQEILNLISGAKHTIDVAMYALTDETCATALTAAARKATVRVILDHTQTLGLRQIEVGQALLSGGVSVLIGTSPRAHALMHQKTMIVDNAIIATGSLNWSHVAPLEVNDLLILSSRKIASAYMQRFEELWEWILTNEAGYQTPSLPVGIM